MGKKMEIESYLLTLTIMEKKRLLLNYLHK